jgi:hypothetical protein
VIHGVDGDGNLLTIPRWFPGTDKDLQRCRRPVPLAESAIEWFTRIETSALSLSRARSAYMLWSFLFSSSSSLSRRRCSPPCPNSVSSYCRRWFWVSLGRGIRPRLFCLLRNPLGPVRFGFRWAGCFHRLTKVMVFPFLISPKFGEGYKWISATREAIREQRSGFISPKMPPTTFLRT